MCCFYIRKYSNIFEYFRGKGDISCLQYRGIHIPHTHIHTHTHTHTLFCVAKRKKGNKGKEESVSKQKLLKGCHQGQNVTPLAILERLEFKNFSCWPTMVGEKCISLFCNVYLLQNGS